LPPENKSSSFVTVREENRTRRKTENWELESRNKRKPVVGTGSQQGSSRAKKEPDNRPAPFGDKVYTHSPRRSKERRGLKQSLPGPRRKQNLYANPKHGQRN
jgi:hypothetical protein